jgi:hypothetical protein
MCPLLALNLVFIRLETKATIFTFGRQRQLISFAYDFGPASHQEDIPARFAAGEEARNSPGHICILASRSVQLNSVAKTQVAIELICSAGAFKLRHWSSAFSTFVTAQPALLDAATNRAILTVEIHKLLMNIRFKIDFVRAVNDEATREEFTFEFETIISHATEIITPLPPAQSLQSKESLIWIWADCPALSCGVEMYRLPDSKTGA